MKKITLEKIISSLESMSPTVEITEEERQKACAPLTRMLELAR